MAGPCLPRPPILAAAFLYLFMMFITGARSADTDALLAFKSELSGGDVALADWKENVSPCKGDDPVWTGVLCTGGSVMGLQLENMKLSGLLKLDALAGIQGLRTLSFMNNAFEGTMPELNKFGVLKSLYLSSNKLTGPIPDDAFTGMGSLKKVYLSQNRFEGAIPKSLTGLPRLLELTLDGNAFTGSIPDLRQKDLKLVNVSNNQLEGPIPEGLSKMDATMFAGNKGLCGPPLNLNGSACSTNYPADPAPAPEPAAPGKKQPSMSLLATIVAIAVGVGLSVLGAMLAVVRRQREEQIHQLGRMQPSKKPGNYHHPTKKGTNSVPPQNPSGRNVKAAAVDTEENESVSEGSARKKHEQQPGKLVFVNALKGDRERFELQDLLKASAEILPGGCLGSCYKATLMNGASVSTVSVVVKRFKEMNAVGREDFQEHMSRLGRLSHPNLLPFIAYYYRREEKLIVTEYSQSGSLANILHGGNTSGMLDWPARLKIVKGIARGLVYLYESLRMLGLPHGHLKSSNVVLDQSTGEPLLTDYGLAPVVNQAHAAQVMVAYKAPEIRQYGRTTKKSDVWCFGILILEILTGKQGTGGTTTTTKDGNVVDLASWVVREEWTGYQVFDGAMKGTENAKGEMLKLLRIGLACCEQDVDKRWEMSEALDRIEELKERED